MKDILPQTDWMSVKQFDSQRHNFLSGVGHDVLHVPTGKVYRNHKYSYDDEKMLLEVIVPNGDWDKAEYVEVPTSECRMRHEEKQMKKLAKILPELSVGDWVRCSGSKGRYPWRKIVTINTKNMIIYGQCASAPDEKHLQFHSSENGIVTIVEHIKGVK